MKLSSRLYAAAAVPAILLATAPRALGADGERTPLNLDGAETAKAASGGGGSVMRTFIGLAVVVAVIYGIYWILKQVKASREERAHGSGLTSLATLPLGAGRSLHMVRAGNEVVLVGSAEHGVTPIRTYAEPEARAAGLLDTIADDELALLHDLAHADWRAPDAVNGTATELAPPARALTAAARPNGNPGVRQAVDVLRRRTVRR